MTRMNKYRSAFDSMMGSPKKALFDREKGILKLSNGRERASIRKVRTLGEAMEIARKLTGASAVYLTK